MKLSTILIGLAILLGVTSFMIKQTPEQILNGGMPLPALVMVGSAIVLLIIGLGLRALDKQEKGDEK